MATRRIERTKGLEKTMLECGKPTEIKFELTRLKRAQRAQNNRLLTQICHTPSMAEELYLPSHRDISGCGWINDMNFNIGVINRMIEKRVGHPWPEVRRLITQRCKHVNYKIWKVIKRNLDWLEEHPQDDDEFIIDDNGVLQRYKDITQKNNETRKRSLTDEQQQQLKEDFLKWLDDRKIGKVGSKYFWMVLIDKQHTFQEPRYRQDRQLTKKESFFMNQVLTSLKKDWNTSLQKNWYESWGQDWYTNYLRKR